MSSTGRADASIGELVKQLSEQSSRLARQEVALAEAELAVKGKKAGVGVGMFGGAGVFGSTDSARWSRPPCSRSRRRSRPGSRR